MRGAGCVQHRALNKDLLVCAWPFHLQPPISRQCCVTGVRCDLFDMIRLPGAHALASWPADMDVLVSS